MILDAKSGLRGILVNAETGQRIPFARWANTETGEWEALAATPDGKSILQPKRIVRGKCRLRFVPSAGFVAPRPTVPEDPPLAAGETKRVLAIPGRECEERFCHREAVWLTGDEEELEPQIGTDGRGYERGRVVRIHRYCNEHYRPPVHTSRRGVESEIEITTARPQW